MKPIGSIDSLDAVTGKELAPGRRPHAPYAFFGGPANAGQVKEGAAYHVLGGRSA